MIKLTQSVLRGILVTTIGVVGVSTTCSAITIDLNPAKEFPTTFNGQQVIAVGRDGLYLDSNTAGPAAWQGNPAMNTAMASYTNPTRNFTFLDVVLEIDDSTGNGTVNGTIRNNADAGDVYSLQMNLTGMCIRNGGTCSAKSSNPALDLRAFLNNPANARNSVLGTDLNTGFEWSTVSLNITNLPGGSAPQYNGLTNFQGWTMAPHTNPVELHIWSNSPGPGELYFNAWYQVLTQAGLRIGIGDTKSFGVLRAATQPPTDVPEPSSIALLSVAGIGILRKRRANKNS